MSKGKMRGVGSGWRTAAAALLTLGLASFADAGDAQWTTAAGDPGGNRYSSLDQINAGNVASLKLAFSFSMGAGRGQEAAPIIAGDTLFIVTPFPNTVYALDLTKPGASVKWRFDPKPDPASRGVACCDHVNRGAAYADGKLFFNTLDDQT